MGLIQIIKTDVHSSESMTQSPDEVIERAFSTSQMSHLEIELKRESERDILIALFLQKEESTALELLKTEEKFREALTNVHQMGSCPIHFAAQGCFEVISFVKDMDPHYLRLLGVYGSSCLHFSTYVGHQKIAEYLCDTVPELLVIKNNFGFTALDTALLYYQIPVAIYLADRLTVKEIMQENFLACLRFSILDTVFSKIGNLLQGNKELITKFIEENQTEGEGAKETPESKKSRRYIDLIKEIKSIERKFKRISRNGIMSAVDYLIENKEQFTSLQSSIFDCYEELTELLEQKVSDFYREPIAKFMMQLVMKEAESNDLSCGSEAYKIERMLLWAGEGSDSFLINLMAQYEYGYCMHGKDQIIFPLLKDLKYLLFYGFMKDPSKLSELEISKIQCPGLLKICFGSANNELMDIQNQEMARIQDEIDVLKELTLEEVESPAALKLIKLAFKDLSTKVNSYQDGIEFFETLPRIADLYTNEAQLLSQEILKEKGCTSELVDCISEKFSGLLVEYSRDFWGLRFEMPRNAQFVDFLKVLSERFKTDENKPEELLTVLEEKYKTTFNSKSEREIFIKYIYLYFFSLDKISIVRAELKMKDLFRTTKDKRIKELEMRLEKLKEAV